MLVAGIDQSYSNLATVFTDGVQFNNNVQGFPPAKYGTGVSRLREIQHHIFDRFSDKEPAVICMEGYAHGARFGREMSGELSGAIRLSLFDMGFEPIIIAPKMLKKYVTGKGNASKKEMIIGVQEKWGQKYTDDNLADAAGLSMLAFALLSSNGTNLLPYEQEVLNHLGATKWSN